ncbi:aconitate hydratase [Candidatus Haliotispira prima]|uniref:Aconitate hydratase A n=1 Tax=Candidatus Haliotispira prima TaxID=3034016 RepID=A0ABY8MJL3_9SPIO|nr:aconitate hydratase [Candidatus Haliotispira prima]
MNLTQKILQAHSVGQEILPVAGESISIRIDQTLTQDSTGTMAYLQLEALEVGETRAELSVAYVDHNMLQAGFESADDHRYIQSVAEKHQIWVSKPGNGICHQVHLERFGVPGKTLIGSDSHTPTCGGLGMIAIGAGGQDVAMAMGGHPYAISMPAVVGVKLEGKLQGGVAAKDVILEVLRQLTVKGGVGRVIEYYGEGVKTLSVPERATIANMGAELGATTSVFPSDEMTKDYLERQGRAEVWRPLEAEADADYDLDLTISLTTLEPHVAKPHSPDNVVSIGELLGTEVDQVCIGSCTNSSYLDLMRVAAILKGRSIHPGISLTVSPGSKQVLSMIAANGALGDILDAGARILETGCGPCIGMGQAPPSEGVSLRTFNRNFTGRSGTKNSFVYLASPEIAAYSAIQGCISDPRELAGTVEWNIPWPEKFHNNNNLLLAPDVTKKGQEVLRGPNIKPFPLGQVIGETWGRPDTGDRLPVIIMVGDNITTDHIMPSNANLLPYRSNIPYLAGFCLNPCDADFAKNAEAAKEQFGGSIIVGGDNYGQGSSREHAALTPLYLGVKAVIVKSFARIHRANLINNGILPLVFADPQDYDGLETGQTLVVRKLREQLLGGQSELVLESENRREVKVLLQANDFERKVLAAGGKINLLKG